MRAARVRQSSVVSSLFVSEEVMLIHYNLFHVCSVSMSFIAIQMTMKDRSLFG